MQIPNDVLTTVPEALRRGAEQFGDRDWIVMPDRRLSFRAAEVSSRRIAKELLAAGHGKGSRIGFVHPSSCEWVLCWLAIARIGAVAMPFSTSYTAAELRRAVHLGDVHTLIVPSEILGDDRLRLVEDAFPGLAEASGDAPLLLDAMPFLRAVRVSGANVPRWGRPISLAIDDPAIDGGAEADTASPVSDALFDAVEAEVTPADWMIVIHTSGSTAEPKSVVHTHGSAIRHGHNLSRFNQIDPDQRAYAGMPFFWVGGVAVTLTTSLVVGSAVLCLERWDPAACLDLMEREGATMLLMWPNHIHGLFEFAARAGRDTSGIPFFQRAAATAPPIPGDTGIRHNSLGMTETWGPHTGPGTEVGRVLPEELRGSFGMPIAPVEHRIADPETGETLPSGSEGELCIRGYSLMAGMLEKERHEVFDDDGWFHTGDRGRFVDGYFIFDGRLTGMIKSAGANVSPREVEVAIEAHPDVRMATVVGLPDEERGEVVAAAVIGMPGASLDVSELERTVRAELSNYKVPRRWLVLDEQDVPWLASGKADLLAIHRRLGEPT